jgi:hypothetical protein
MFSVDMRVLFLSRNGGCYNACGVVENRDEGSGW